MIFYIWKYLSNEVEVDGLIHCSRGYHILNAYNWLGLRHMPLYKGAVYISAYYYFREKIDLSSMQMQFMAFGFKEV
jgi:hypothetical protein